MDRLYKRECGSTSLAESTPSPWRFSHEKRANGAESEYVSYQVFHCTVQDTVHY